MKIIDLLNKIANEHKVPEKIKFNDYEYLYHDKEHGYCRPAYDCTYICFDTDFNIYEVLNDEVEILEEEPRDIEVCGSLFTRSEYDKLAHSEEEKKIPEKLFFTHISNYNDQSVINNNFNNYFKKTQETINQLIDYLKSKGE